MRILALSPHLDDAILSVGQTLAAYPQSTIMTIFAGSPPQGTKSDYDLKCGFKDSNEAMASRRYEDTMACAQLLCRPIHLGFLDNQYKHQVGLDKISEKIMEHLRDNDYQMILAPVGLKHPDHIAVSTVAHRLPISEIPIYYYEELPLRVLEPEYTAQRLTENAKLKFIGDGGRDKKAIALMEYKSQIGSGVLDPTLCFAPERIWEQ
jgi:LmbE family N-acetylglucosaminyl deacetylase